MCASRWSEVHILTKGTGVKKLIPVIGLALAAIAGTATTVAQGKTSSSKAGAAVCVLLPDPKSSVRWETQDRPAFVAAFQKARVTYVIDNANGDAQRQKTQADQCLANGAKVVILTSLDAGSSLTIEKAATAAGAKVIEYDRQVTGGKPDNNSTLFKNGYESVLNPLYKNGTFAKGPQQYVPDWDNQKAGTIFEQMLVKTSNKINAVAAANDGLANAVVVALKAHGLKPIPLSGQDATPQGVQNIISGWQTMTVWKDTRILAKAAARSAIQLLKGQKLSTTGSVKNGTKTEPAFIIQPISVTKANWRKLYTSGFLKKSDICNGSYKQYC